MKCDPENDERRVVDRNRPDGRWSRDDMRAAASFSTGHVA